MKKLNALRQHLVDSVPDLKTNPDKLLTFIDNGRIKFTRGQHLSHEYVTPVQIIVTDYAGDMDELVIPMLQWLASYEPDLVPDEAVSLEAEILDNHTIDIAMSVQLTERVVAIVECPDNEPGQINVEHRMPEYPLIACAAKHWELYIRREGQTDYDKVAEWDSAPQP